MPSSIRASLVLALAAVLTAGQLSGLAASPSQAAGCLSSGTDATIQAALTGAGAQAVLCPGAVFLLGATVHFTAANQAILTQGLPTDNTRATLRLNASGVTGAISGGGQNGVTVENLQVDGNIGTLGRGSGDALLEMGNQGSNQIIQNNFLHDTRSWSTLHVMEGSVTNDVPSCQGAQVLNNLVMSAGTNVPSGTWADGISLACGTSLVQGNTVIDATDGSIVVFGAPGSTVQNNTVIAQSRVMLGGINMVDYEPVHGNYTGTKVQNNVVDARGALIKVGMAMGPGTWFCEPDTTVNHGATVTGNTLQGNHMGYGYAVRGVSSWTVTGNVDSSVHSGVAGSMCGGGTQNPQAPAGFQYYAPATSATLQSQFQPVTGNFWGLLNITENVGSAPLIYAAQSALTFAPVAVGTSYTPQTVTITNTGPATASVSGVSVTGDYSQTNNCSNLTTGSSCVVSVTFHPSASGTRSGTLTVSSNAGNGPASVSLTGTGSGGGTAGTNLAAGRPSSASSTNASYVPGNVTDADTGSYWESSNNAFPQWVQVDLGSAQSIGRLTLRLPAGWGARTETLSVQGSTDGSTFSTLVGSAGYTFDPGSANTVNVTVPTTTARYVRVNVTANNGWPAAQLSDLEVFASTGGGTGSATLSATPTSLTFPSTSTGTTTAAQVVTVHNIGTAAASVSAVATTGDFQQTNTCGSSVAAGASCTVSVTFKPTATGTRTGTVTVSSNATNPSLAVQLTGTGTTPTASNLAAGRPATASSSTQTYIPGNVTDTDPSSYWESANNAFPQWIQVDLGSAQQLGRVVLRLPPATSWSARQQTLALTGSTDGTTFTTVKSAASYGFDPSTGNTVTVTFPAVSVRYLRATFTANTGWPAGQLSSYEAYVS